MGQKYLIVALTGFSIFGLPGFAFSQDLSAKAIDKIKNEISLIFDESLLAGERLDVTAISENVNDSLRTGFIDNGYYFKTFEELIAGFKAGTQGLEYQKMNIDTRKVTVLSENNVLLTASGNYSAKVVDGRILNGRFAWSFLYSRINGKWKVIHTHMSSPKS